MSSARPGGRQGPARARQFPAVILRVAGIYGPGRGHLFQQYLRNEVRIPGKGERLTVAFDVAPPI